MIKFNWKFLSIALVCVLASGFVAVTPYATAQVTTNRNSLFVSDQACEVIDCSNINQYVKQVDLHTATQAVTSIFATSSGAPGTINGPRGIIFTGGVSPVMLLANQNPNTNLHGDIAMFNPSNGNFLGFLVQQSDPNAPFAPRGIVLSPDHNTLYVADFQSSSTATSGLIRTYIASGQNAGHFIASYSAQALLQHAPFNNNFSPRGIVFGPDGLLYISVFDMSDSSAGYILTFNPSAPPGQLFKVLVASDAANNYASGMHRPEGIVFDSSGNLWVTSFCVRDSSGNCAAVTGNVDKITEFSTQPSKSSNPPGIVLGRIQLENSPPVAAQRTPAQAILFGPNLGSGNL